jgi:hypothetical protein
VGREADLDPVVEVEPLGVVLAPLGLERDPGHEAEGLAEVAEGEPARDRLLLLVVLPVRQLQLGQLLAHLFGTQHLQLLVGWQLQLVSHLRPPCRR